MSNEDVSNETVRDFLYLDEEWLDSLYAQRFQGLHDLIEEIDDELKSTKVTGDKNSEKLSKEIGKRTEKVLHDYTYNRLEAKLSGKMVVGRVEDSSFMGEVSEGDLVKIKGKGRIEDYNRMSDLLRNFNDRGLAMAKVMLGGARMDDGEGMPDNAAEKIKRERRQQRKGELEDINAEQIAKALNMRLDEDFLDAFNTIVEWLGSKSKWLSLGEFPEASFTAKAPLGERGMRVALSRARWLYVGRTDIEWNLVGIATKIFEPNAGSDGGFVGNESAGSEEMDGMREAISGMFDASENFEKLFLGDTDSEDVIVKPLSVYHKMGTAS